jgi:hypothetical protein
VLTPLQRILSSAAVVVVVVAVAVVLLRLVVVGGVVWPLHIAVAEPSMANDCSSRTKRTRFVCCIQNEAIPAIPDQRLKQGEESQG